MTLESVLEDNKEKIDAAISQIHDYKDDQKDERKPWIREDASYNDQTLDIPEEPIKYKEETKIKENKKTKEPEQAYESNEQKEEIKKIETPKEGDKTFKEMLTNFTITGADRLDQETKKNLVAYLQTEEGKTWLHFYEATATIINRDYNLAA